jgi:hypothetical protein
MTDREATFRDRDELKARPEARARQWLRRHGVRIFIAELGRVLIVMGRFT